jgi:hypothetical protein
LVARVAALAATAGQPLMVAVNLQAQIVREAPATTILAAVVLAL